MLCRQDAASRLYTGNHPEIVIRVYTAKTRGYCATTICLPEWVANFYYQELLCGPSVNTSSIPVLRPLFR